MGIDDSAPDEDAVTNSPANEAALLEASEDAIDIALATIENTENCVYTGEPLALPIAVTYKGETLVEGVDYTVEYFNNVEAGTATIRVYGEGRYMGMVLTEREILPASIEDATLTGLEAQTFNGKEICPKLVVTVGDRALVENMDYAVSFEKNYDAGEAFVIVEGRDNYTGRITASFDILPASIEDVADIEIDDSAVYDVYPCQPWVTLVVGDRLLYLDKDYELTYENNTDVGVASVKISGIGNYTGTVVRTFTIEPAPLPEPWFYGVRDYQYTGEAYTPEVKLTDKIANLVEGVDYTVTYSDNVYPGKAKCTVTGMGNYQGTRSLTFTIAQRDIKAANVKCLYDTPYVYTGEVIVPNLVLTDGDRTLVEGTDYTLRCDGNINAGTAYLAIEGLGNYCGAVKYNYTIEPQPVEVEVRLKEGHTIDKVYDKTRNLLLTSSDLEVYPETVDGDVVRITKISAAFDSADVGDYTVKVTIDISSRSTNYTYTLANNPFTIPGKITPKRLKILPGKSSSVGDGTLVSQSKVYGTAEPTFYIGQIKGIMSGDVEVIDNVANYDKVYTGQLGREPGEDAGKYRITLGTLETVGNYATEPLLEEGYFEITPKPLSDGDILMYSIPNQQYTGEAIEPEVSLKYGDQVLEKGVDFDVQFNDNIERGTAIVNVVGKGNFTGTRIATFNILRTATTTSQTISVSSIADQTYTGSAIEPGLTVVATRLVEDEVETKFLVKGVDYDVVFTNNVQPGTATAYLVGKGDYSFGKAVTFRIVKPASQAAPAAPAPAPAAPALAPAPTVPVVPAVSKSTRTTIAAAPGAVAQLDLGGATGTKYKSSNKKVATVDQNGLVTFKKAGKVKITMKVGRKKRTVTLTVKDPTIPTFIVLNLAGTVPAQVGVPQALTVTLPEGTISGIKWKSSNKKVATVSNGVVTFKKKGKVTITATATRGKKKAKVKFVVTK